MSKCKNPVQSKGDFKSWCMVNLHSQFLKKRRKKKNHVISKVTPKVCMLFKTAVYDGSWDKRDETVLNILLTRCWLKKKKKKEMNRKIMNQKKIPIPGIYDFRMDIWMILPFFSCHPNQFSYQSTTWYTKEETYHNGIDDIIFVIFQSFDSL